ncbi:hypothetical protein SAMN05444671_3735 [Flavobacterium sp. CF108]|uniref:hypothetical protein n=1 Tax=unclassified Flavobacterium TaxID=196869 RepID=UPI0008CB9304|nr:MULTISPECIES: hypothetical protein [unclassified Flavobacterium]SEO54539.1 hypothetical protein SAMN04487978_3169 [Flavobacterium sp. fv08]SHH75484.1 hypothetical protein SAMN05444671_3735 [Flavobacterium sp. CF108]
MSDNNIKYRTYKTSINILIFSFYTNSKVYEIPNGRSTILPGIKYSILTILFGWWGFGWPWEKFREIKNSIIALHINFDGGEDYTKVFSEMDYDEKTVWVFNNLRREIFEKVDIQIIDIMIDLQTEFIKSESAGLLEKNIMFMNENLKKLNIINLRNSDLEEIINKMEAFEFKSN